MIIPASVVSIGEYAFRRCESLSEVYFCGNAPAMGNYVFNGYPSDFTIYYLEWSTGFTNPWYGYPTAVSSTSECLITSTTTTPATTTIPQTLIELKYFTAEPKSNKMNINWSTDSEIDNSGFNLYRSDSRDGEYIKINDELIPAEGSPTQGASYTFTDAGLQNRKTYWYKLEDIDLNGQSTMHGTVSATPRLIYGISP